jgi:type II secretory pathway component PulF
LLLYFLIVAHHLGFYPHWLPFVSWFRRRYDAAVALHALAAGVRAQLPLPDVLRLLSETYRVRRMKRRLQRVSKDVAAGAETWQSMQRNGLIRPSEAAALRGAERVGNLPFALEAIRSTIIRREEFRLHLAGNVLQTVGLMTLAAMVLIATMAIIYPLSHLTLGLATGGPTE